MAVGRANNAGTFALELAGAPAGFPVSVAGGEAFAVVAEEQPRATWVTKHVAGVAFADIVIEASAPLSAPLQSWIASLFDGQQAAMSGAIVFLDFASKAQQRLEWTNGAISEVTFPPADGASKEAARIRVTITPEMARLVAGSGAEYERPILKQKVVSQANFRFSLPGLEQAAAKVSKVSSISVTRRASDGVGEERDFEKVGVVLDASDIAVTLPQSEARTVRGMVRRLRHHGQQRRRPRTKRIVDLPRDQPQERAPQPRPRRRRDPAHHLRARPGRRDAPLDRRALLRDGEARQVISGRASRHSRVRIGIRRPSGR